MARFNAINAVSTSSDPRTAYLRRPQTANPSDFWYCTQERWDEQLTNVKDPSKTKLALNTLRKFDAAGRIMETNEGAVAVEACYWCGRRDSGVVCKLYADGRDISCAYCKRNQKSGCTARLTASPPTLEERLLGVEEALKNAVEEIKELKEENRVLKEEIEGLKEATGQFENGVQWIQQLAGELANVGRDIQTMWNHLWPSSE